MTARSLILALLVMGSAPSYGQSPEAVYVEANKLYQQGKFAEARDGYERVLHNGYESAELYYNLGNAYYKLGHIARAILNYERAKKLSPGDEDLQYNLELVSLLVKDRVEAAPRLFVWDYWDSIKNLLLMSTLTWVWYGAYIIVLASIGVMILSQSFMVRRLMLVCGATSAFVLLVSLSVFIARLSDLDARDAAVVTADIVTIKNSPDSRSTDAFVLHEGVKVQVTDSVNEWIKIRLADGKVGWMERRAAEFI